MRVVDLDVNFTHDPDMPMKPASLDDLLTSLTEAAHRRGLNDAQWAAGAGLPKETLSRLRRRTDCSLSTLQALASAAGAHLKVALFDIPDITSDGHMPTRVDRAYESELLRVCASGSLDPGQWRAVGPQYFMAGLATMLASAREFDRRGLLELAETLHPGMTNPEVFAAWLDRSPVRPSRFLPMVRAAISKATGVRAGEGARPRPKSKKQS
ncbi:MAG: hypothetical protein K2Y35_19730 [Burkholderiales bacterium]|nr:hypothetical protein [Burkholderiales bacterium]